MDERHPSRELLISNVRNRVLMDSVEGARAAARRLRACIRLDQGEKIASGPHGAKEYSLVVWLLERGSFARS